MKTNFKRLLILFAWASIILFVARTLISKNDVVSLVNDKKIFELIYTLFGYAGEAIAVSTLIQIIYDRWLWRVINIWKLPVLSKKYQGSFVSSHGGKEQNAELIIKQTFLNIKIKMKTAESWSSSINETLEEDNGVMVLTYTYLNKPDLKIYDRSKMHYGTAILVCDNAKKLEGNYYTDRKTIGSMFFVSDHAKLEKEGE